MGKLKLNSVDMTKLPELNENYHKQQFKKIRKVLFSEDNGIREQAPRRTNHRSIGRIQRENGPRHLFIDEEGDIKKQEEEADALDSKKKGKKSQADDVKI